MKKIALVTLYDETNFGNRLQNFASYSFLTSLGFECETLVFKKKENVKLFTKLFVKKLLCRTIIGNNQTNRIINFNKFSKKNIPIRIVYDTYSLDQLDSEYDYFIVGSDQVWNPCFGNYDLIYDKMFLLFVSNEKKFCMAPSFGVESIPTEWTERFRIGLNTFDKINVRENSGINIVRELTGKKAQVIIDPTLLISTNEWRRIGRKHNINKPYDFAYFLGKKPKIVTSNFQLDINDKASMNYYKYNPADFLGLIDDAECVYTDSFHACVFSILFGKKFCVYERNDNYLKMNSRISSLFDLFNIKYDFSSPQIISVDCKIRDEVLFQKRDEIVKYYMGLLCK